MFSYIFVQFYTASNCFRLLQIGTLEFQHFISIYSNELFLTVYLQKEHNEALAKVNFVLALSNCILDLAALRTAPIGALHDSMHVSTQVKNELVIRTERFVLLIRALQLMASALSLADNQMKAGTLRPSTAVKTGTRVMIKVLLLFLKYFFSYIKLEQFIQIYINRM